MATERLSMRQTREILRQKWRLGRTHREVAQSLGISCGAVGTTVLRARAAGLDWAQVDTLSDDHQRDFQFFGGITAAIRVQSGPAGTHRPTTRRGSAIGPAGPGRRRRRRPIAIDAGDIDAGETSAHRIEGEADLTP